MILTTDKMVFVTNQDNSDEYIENLITEYGTNQYRIKIDRTLSPPYYQLFYEWKEGKRTLNNHLFSSSRLEKIVDASRLLNSKSVIVRIRYRKQANHCTVNIMAENLLHVQLHEPLESIASGQAAAFYDEVGLLLGGGIII